MSAANPARSLSVFVKPVSPLSFALFAIALFIGFPMNTSAEDAKSSDGTSFTEQCPKLFAIADDFAHECLEKARTRSYEALTDLAGNKITVSGRVYFRPATPNSHFSLGCVVNEKDKTTIDYFGVYYAAKGGNFTIANTDKAEFRDITWLGGNVGFIVDGEPLNLVLVRLFDTGSLPFSDQGFGMRPMLKEEGRVKNCEAAHPPNVKRTEEGDKIDIQFCRDAACEPDRRKYPKPTPTGYSKFFDSNNHQIVYVSAGNAFLIEAGGTLLMRNDVLQQDCSGLTYLMRGTRMGSFTIPDIAREVCKLPH